MSKRKFRIYVDADYAADSDNSKRSIIGYIFMLFGGPISWQIGQQASVTSSIMEFEYMAACSTTQEAIWIRLLLKYLDIFDGDQLMVIREIDTACIVYAKEFRRL